MTDHCSAVALALGHKGCAGLCVRRLIRCPWSIHLPLQMCTCMQSHIPHLHPGHLGAISTPHILFIMLFLSTYVHQFFHIYSNDKERYCHELTKFSLLVFEEKGRQSDLYTYFHTPPHFTSHQNGRQFTYVRAEVHTLCRRDCPESALHVLRCTAKN